MIGFFVYFKLSALLLGVTDPLAPLENLCCAILMGGVWDALNRLVILGEVTRTGIVGP